MNQVEVSQPNLNLLKDYEPYIRWTHLIEVPACLVQEIIEGITYGPASSMFVIDQVEQTGLGLIAMNSRNKDMSLFWNLPPRIAYRSNIIFCLPINRNPAKVLKHREYGGTMSDIQVNTSIDNMLTRMINLR